tara:strand:+ start:854 stop:1312 length:459 start_codon:yes stop_codon:yes gene_type:complete
MQNNTLVIPLKHTMPSSIDNVLTAWTSNKIINGKILSSRGAHRVYQVKRILPKWLSKLTNIDTNLLYTETIDIDKDNRLFTTQSTTVIPKINVIIDSEIKFVEDNEITIVFGKIKARNIPKYMYIMKQKIIKYLQHEFLMDRQMEQKLLPTK